jgi:hypothetical protein
MLDIGIMALEMPNDRTFTSRGPVDFLVVFVAIVDLVT